MNEKMRKAAVAMLEFQRRCLERGFVVSLPVVEGMRYDCVLDNGERLWKVQVKYAGVRPRQCSGSVHLRLDNPPGRGVTTPYRDEIDLLCAYLPKPGIVCVFERGVFDGRRSLQIRFEPTKNGQAKGCLMAQDHAIEKW